MKTLMIFIGLMLFSASSSAALFGKDEDPAKEAAKIAEQQNATRKMRDEILEELYELNPETKSLVEKSVGVAVFDSLGFNLLLLSTARGGGIARETSTGKETFMRMFSAGGGFGMGVKDFRVVFIFHTEEAYNHFLDSGWDFSGQGDAAAELGDKGQSLELAATVTQGTSIYQITKNGLALQVTLQGTKYYKDKKLN
jgi:lipid-binding SYLF domain-containing protein